jgi:hypothetical protein
MLRQIHSDDSASLEVFTGKIYDFKYVSPYRGGKHVLCSNLQDTRTPTFARREEHSEIEVVGKDDKSIGSGVIEDL